MQIVDGVQQTDAEGNPIGVKTFSLHRINPEDGAEARMSLVIGDTMRDPEALAFDMPLSSFLELLAGNVTPPEVMGLYGKPITAKPTRS